MLTADTILFLLAAGLIGIGHTALWVAANNFVHGSAYPWTAVRCFTFFDHLMTLAGWIALAVWVWASRGSGAAAWSLAPPLALVYAGVCLAVALGPVSGWLVRSLRFRHAPVLLSNHSTWIDLAERLGSRPTGRGWETVWMHLPGNQVFHLEVNEKRVEIPRLPAELEGMSIAHVSDLHLTGATSIDFYQEVIGEVNRLGADFNVVCGDIIDTLDCLDWIEPIFGPLDAPHGNYFVLGNHDLRTGDLGLVRRALGSAGLTDLSGRWLVENVRRYPVLLAGNELPYIGPAADLSNAPTTVEGHRPLRIVVAHTPDQMPWARRFDVDLMVAGHMHGGQIRLPRIGPLVAPSRQGTRYAAGVFHEPPTVLHVSRGVSAMTPLRFNCPPEITRLVLVRPRGGPPK